MKLAEKIYQNANEESDEDKADDIVLEAEYEEN